jgi:hypothetical protein
MGRCLHSAGLHYPDEFIEQLLQGVIAMEESTTYQAILRKGRTQGKVEGRTEGRTEGRAEEATRMLLMQGRTRFRTPPPPAIAAAIGSITDIEQLEQLGVRLVEVNSWEELIPSA